MKNNIMKFLSVLVFILGPVVILLAQGPPLPSDPGSNGLMPGAGAPTVNGPNPSGAPIGTGVWILLALALGYSIYQYWIIKKAEKLA